MKTFTGALQSELIKSTSRLATCMRIERLDGNIYGFTTNRRILTIDGIEYHPAASFNPTDIQSKNDISTDDLQVEGFLSSTAITEDELRAGRWDYAAFRIFQVNWASPTTGQKKDRAGHLGQVTVNRSTFVAELLGMMEAYGTSIGEITQPACRASLGDERCKVDLVGSPSFTVTGIIDSMLTDFFTMYGLDRIEATGYFNEGIITIHYDTGDIRYEVKNYEVGFWITKTAVAYDVTGVAYTMSRGCDRRLSTCRDVFNNVDNFRGEPWLRGNDALVQIGRHDT